MAAKKKVVVAAPILEKATEGRIFVKGPHHIVKDGQIIVDPNFVNPGVFSSKA